MDLLVIAGDRESKITFGQPSFDSDGWMKSYVIEASMPGVFASVLVDNNPAGHPPLKFFSELASSWRGWKWEKSWGALEGEYGLVATCDSLGHITLSAHLESDPAQIAPCWKAVVSISLEAGQLDRIQRDVEEFFKYVP